MADRAEAWHPSCLANNQPNFGHVSRAKWDQQSSQHMSNKCFLLYTTEILFVQQHIVAVGDWYTPSCCSVAKSCLTFCDPVDCSSPGFPVPLSPRVCLDSCSSSRWCHPTISSSVVPFSSCPRSFPASGSSSMSQPFESGGHSIGVSASNEYSGLISFRIDWFDLLAVQGIVKSLLQDHSSRIQRHQFFITPLSVWSPSHIRTPLLEKPQLWLDGPLSAKWRLCFLICCLGLSQLTFHSLVNLHSP